MSLSFHRAWRHRSDARGSSFGSGRPIARRWWSHWNLIQRIARYRADDEAEERAGRYRGQRHAGKPWSGVKMMTQGRTM